MITLDYRVHDLVVHDRLLRKSDACLAALERLLPLRRSLKTRFSERKLSNVAGDERLDQGTTYRWADFTVQIAYVAYMAKGPKIRRHSGEAPKVRSLATALGARLMAAS